MTTYYSHKIEDILTKYYEICEWFDSLGFNSMKTRYGKYKIVFDDFFSQSEKKDFDDFKIRFDNAYMEIHDAIRIYNTLKNIETSEFLVQMKKVLSGQEFRAQKDNDQARDFLFELLIASRFIKAGYKVSLTGICDIAVELENGQILFVECKRIKSLSKIEKNIKKANEQLKKRMKKHINNKALGLVAVNITDVLPLSDYIIRSNDDVGSYEHKIRSEKIVRENYQKFLSGINKKCLGVMCESSMMNYIKKGSNKYDGLNFQCSRHTEYLFYSDNMLYKNLAPTLSNQDI